MGRQVEHYFSDRNLVNDEFFRKRISESEDGWVSIGHVMACPIIRMKGATVDEIVACLVVSNKLEVRETPIVSIRRVGNAPVGSSWPCSCPAPKEKRKGKDAGTDPK